MTTDFYANHLSEVNNVNRVVAGENICNEQGQLVLPEGTVINQGALDSTLKFKLEKPLENSVVIENQFDEDSLLQEIEKLFLADPNTSALWHDIADDGLVAACCNVVCQDTLVAQKLTVLSLQFPKLFAQSVFCGVFAARMIADNNADPDLIIDAFIAGALHDIGMLHLNPDFVLSQRSLNAEEWKVLQSHPLIGAAFAKSVPCLSDDVVKGIAQHHETIDGTGYPAGKIAQQIHPIALTLQMLDSVWAIYTKQFKILERSLGDILPLIQMNSNYRHNNYARALVVLFKKIPPTTHCLTPDTLVGDLVDFVLDQDKYITTFSEITAKISKTIGFRHGDKKLLGLQNTLIYIHVSLQQSGIINPAYMRWLEVVKAENLQHAYREVEDVNLMLAEILFHIKRFKVHLALIQKATKSPDIALPLKEVNTGLQQLRLGKPSEALTKYLPSSSLAHTEDTIRSA